MLNFTSVKKDKYSIPNVDLKLSPVSQFVIDVATDLLKSGKNVVIEFPSSFSNLSLIIGYYYSYATKKSTLIFTKNENIAVRNDLYYQLMDDSVPLYIRVPIGIKTDNGIKLKENFIKKKINSNLKVKYIESMQNNLVDVEKPLIVLVSEDEFIKNIEGSYIQISKKCSKGLAIFENISTKDTTYTDLIIQWCNKENVNYLFLTNYSSPNFYEHIKKRNDIVLMPFHNGILECESSINNVSTNYYANANYKKVDFCLDLFNIDREYNYKQKNNVGYEVIQNGKNFSIHLKDISNSISKLDDVDVNLKKELLSLAKTAYESIESFSTVDYLTKYSSHSNNRVNGIGFCENIKKLVLGYSPNIKYQCESIIDSFWAIRNIIEKSRSPIFDNGYKKENKFSRLFQLIDKYAESNCVIYIVTVNKREIAYLDTIMKEYRPNLKDKLIVTYPGNIDITFISKGILILSGKLEYNQLSVLDFPFEKKIVLVYAKDNEKIVHDMIDMYEKVDEYRKKLFINSIQQIFEQENILADYRKRYDYIVGFEDTAFNLIDTNICTVTEYLDLIQKGLDNYPNLLEYLKMQVYINKFDEKLNDELEVNYEHSIRRQYDCYEVMLENVETGKKERIVTSIKTEHIFIDEYGELNEFTFGMESIGLVVIETPGKTTSLLDMLIELYNLDDHINKSIIELWDDSLKTFEKNSRSVTDLYKVYQEYGGKKEKQTVRTWLNRSILGPRDKTDIKVMGAVLSIEELESESEYIFEELEKIRRMKRSLGRHLSKIIAISIKKGEILDDPISIGIWENVKGYLFKVKDVVFIPKSE